MADGKGVVMSVAMLGVVLEAHVATAAPPGLVATTTAAALADSGALVAAIADPIAGGISTLLTLAQAKVAAAMIAGVAIVSAAASAAVVLAAHAPPATRPANVSPATTRAATTDAPTNNFPRLAPFDGVRWNDGDVPTVRVENIWCELVAIDDMPAERIIGFCKNHYHNLWQKRFEEDLVEVLAGLAQQPGDRVKLTVRDPDRKQVSELLDVRMTRANRQQLWLARQAEQERQKAR